MSALCAAAGFQEAFGIYQWDPEMPYGWRRERDSLPAMRALFQVMGLTFLLSMMLREALTRWKIGHAFFGCRRALALLQPMHNPAAISTAGCLPY